MNFMILAAGRSGSTLLVNYLSSHPDIRCHHEPFNQNGWHRELKSFSKPIEALNHLDSNNLAIPAHIKMVSAIQKSVGLHRGKIVIDPFKSTHELASEGFKVTWAQANLMFEDMENWLSNKNDMKCIFLYRCDYLARFVSYELAHKNHLWNSSYKTHITKPFEVSKIRFRQFCDREINLENKLWAMLIATGIDVSALSYEELIGNPIKHVNRELAFLDHHPLNHAEAVTTKLVSTALEELVTNHEDLASNETNMSSHKERLERIKLYNFS